MNALDLVGLSAAQARVRLGDALSAAGIVSAHSEAQQLLLGALGLDRLGLVLHSAPLTEVQAHTLAGWAAQRARRIPLQHILGQVEWGGLLLEVSPDALIPRPETEMLLELAKAQLERLTANSAAPLRVLDVGTGTGALALALRHWLDERPLDERAAQSTVWASDISPQALALAQKNAQQLGLAVQFFSSDLLQHAPTGLDLLVSNPPYLPAEDVYSTQPEVQHDPPLALYSGSDGLQLARRLMTQAQQHLGRRGVVLLELDPRNVQVLARELRPQWQVTVYPDLTGRERFLAATWP